MMKFALASATMVLLASPALAQVTTQPTTPTPPASEDKFIKSDKDGDGALSVAEVKAADAKVTQADFDKYDGDKSKSLSKEEFTKWVEAKTSPPASKPG
jgi:opacity protein-like surface antigen